jgi:hypothetical protein
MLSPRASNCYSTRHRFALSAPSHTCEIMPGQYRTKRGCGLCHPKRARLLSFPHSRLTFHIPKVFTEHTRIAFTAIGTVTVLLAELPLEVREEEREKSVIQWSLYLVKPVHLEVLPCIEHSALPTRHNDVHRRNR